MDKVDWAIPNEIIRRAQKCKREHACLRDGLCGDDEECSVDWIDGENVLFLASKKAIPCPYRLPFGDRLLCVCPVHYAIAKMKAENSRSG